jgi:hypothetical protein
MLSGFKIQDSNLSTVGASLLHILSVLDINWKQLNNNDTTDTYLSGLFTTPYYNNIICFH